MKQPENKKELQLFLGLCQYLTKFTPELASLSEPLRFLTRKNTPFIWMQEHVTAFAHIKQTLTREQELAHFNPEKETVIQTDASIRGLGACLLQESKPVYYAMVHSVSVELPAMKDFLDRVRTATKKDRELQLLAQQVKQGWPKKINEVDDQIQCYWSFREDITIVDKILVKGHRIIIPRSMRKYMLSQVHEGHFGMDKCKMHMSNCCYWPGVNKEIENMIRNCPTCLKFALSKHKIKKKDMLHHEVPDTPWMKLATDIFHFQGTNYLILVDYTSKFPVVKQLRKVDQQAITVAFEEIFTEHGYPDELVSDNGPCYRGEQFTEFLKRKGIKHVTSSP